jgi:hypothetical protein
MASMSGRVPFRPRVLRWLLAILGVLALVAAHAVWDYAEARLLKAAVDRIPPETRQAPGPPDVAPARDAAPYFLAAGDLVLRDASLIGRVEDDLHRALLRGAVPDDLRQRARALITGSDALRLFDRATALEFRGFSPMRPGHPFEVNMLARLDGIRAVVSALDGDRDTAVSSIATELEVEGDPHGLADPRTLVPRFMTSVANLQVVLTATTPDDASLARIAAALGVADQDDVLAHYFEHRRDFALSMTDDASSAEFGRAGLFGHSGLTLVERIEHPVTARGLRRALERMQAEIDAAHRPWPGRIEAVADRMAAGTAMARWLRRSLNVVVADLAAVRAARVVVAIERYRRTHGGQVPADLGQLPASLLEAVPIDPFSRAPIRFRALASSYAVYSVGPDGKDDGGATTGLEAFGHEWPSASADIGVRIAR